MMVDRVLDIRFTFSNSVFKHGTLEEDTICALDTYVFEGALREK